MRIAEIFKSLQGEGPSIGLPTTFIRFCGCNLRCKFGCKTETEKERCNDYWKSAANNVIARTINDLPRYDIGCDSYYAVIPEIYNRFIPEIDLDEVVETIRDLNCNTLCFTGGEPLLEDNLKAIMEIMDAYPDKDFHLETNGTLLTEETLTKFNYYNSIHNKKTLIISSPKIKYSPLYTDEVIKNINQFSDYIKIVSNGDEKDLVLQCKGFDRNKIILMPEGRTKEVYLKNANKVADLCIEYGLRYTPRLQVDLWNDEVGK